MKIKQRQNHFAKKKGVIQGECCKCKRTVIFEKMYIINIKTPRIFCICVNDVKQKYIKI